jgi:hypothetical protein
MKLGLSRLKHFDTQHQFERCNFFIDRLNKENLDISPDKFLNKENMTILTLRLARGCSTGQLISVKLPKKWTFAQLLQNSNSPINQPLNTENHWLSLDFLLGFELVLSVDQLSHFGRVNQTSCPLRYD